MVGQRNVEVRRHPEQLVLAFGEWLPNGGLGTSAVTSARVQRLPGRDAHGRFVAGDDVSARSPRMGTLLPRDKALRVRAIPFRDSRGRFVGYPATNAPSWCVFCCDGYRIPGESPPAPLPPIAPAAQDASSRVATRPRLLWFTRSELQSALLVLIVLIVSVWYGFHLPHHIGETWRPRPARWDRLGRKPGRTSAP